jgi:hypothetical protein
MYTHTHTHTHTHARTHTHTHTHTHTGHTQKNGAVSKVDNNLFLTLHGHSIHCQQRELYTFLLRYQQFASHAYCGAVGPVSTMASQQEKAFCVLCFEVSRSVITVQREIHARFKKTLFLGGAPFLNRTRNTLCTHCVCVCACVYVYLYIFVDKTRGRLKNVGLDRENIKMDLKEIRCQDESQIRIQSWLQ